MNNGNIYIEKNSEICPKAHFCEIVISEESEICINENILWET